MANVQPGDTNVKSDVKQIPDGKGAPKPATTTANLGPTKTTGLGNAVEPTGLYVDAYSDAY